MDVTSKIQLLGNPFTKSIFAKNVWDMQVFNNRIYLAHGDFNSNAGPIPVIYFDPSTNKFITHFTVDDEEINNLKAINGKLYIPGVDAKEGWEFGNIYVVDQNSSYIKYRTIPKANHVFDIAYFNGQLYIACGTAKAGWGEVLTSKDGGLTWESVTPKGIKFANDWCTALFEMDGKLYAAGRMYSPSRYAANQLAKDMFLVGIGEKGPEIQAYTNDFTQGQGTASFVYNVERATAFNGSLVFLANNNLFAATALDKSRRLALPVKVYDLLVRGNVLYVLGYLNGMNIVYQSTDLQVWTEVLRFKSDTFARSFEELNGDFYFGLGCEAGKLVVSTGNILRVAV